VTPSPPLRARSAAALSLLLSSGTLICCTLPLLMVVLGAGSVLAALISWFPALVLISEQKPLVFLLAAAALGLAALALRRAARFPCPSDPLQARHCRRRLGQARWLFRLSLFAYGVGGVVTWLLPLVLRR
jgi:hypothetical protein